MQSEHRDVLNELVEYERKCLSQQKTIDDLTKQIREVKAENSRTLKAKYTESESNRWVANWLVTEVGLFMTNKIKSKEQITFSLVIFYHKTALFFLC